MTNRPIYMVKKKHILDPCEIYDQSGEFNDLIFCNSDVN